MLHLAPSPARRKGFVVKEKSRRRRFVAKKRTSRRKVFRVPGEQQETGGSLFISRPQLECVSVGVVSLIQGSLRCSLVGLFDFATLPAASKGERRQHNKLRPGATHYSVVKEEGKEEQGS